MYDPGWKYVCGMMSGTSLDGLDICLAAFRQVDKKWHYKIIQASTIEYDEHWKDILPGLMDLSGEQLMHLHASYGRFLGKSCKTFLEKSGATCDFIASHGHTVFHQPRLGFTFQLGDGAAIAAVSGLPVISDFRSGDVALGGQGAPLVPQGDRLLFPEYDACLNIGGFANISFEKGGDRIAYDICPANKALNHLSKTLGLDFDDGGQIAKSGKILHDLLSQLNSLDFYKATGPKSLGEEWLREVFLPLIDDHGHRTQDILRTLTEHIAVQISEGIYRGGASRTLVTGGGAYNDFLIDRIREISIKEIIIPEPKLIEFKEALIFAFLGMLRMENKVNILSAVSGASHDHSGGAIFLP